MIDTINDSRSEQPSGRFVLRLDPGLHAALRQAARAYGSSLNEYCVRRLALPVPGSVGPAGVAVARAAAVTGDALLAVVAFGSWARCEAGPRSDVDLLVVVERSVDIGRRLYQQWDETPVSWNGHAVEPHFVHLPERGARVTGLWAEVATDGVVLFDRGLVVSRLLVAYRHEIMAGRLVRRTVHGQAYWVEAA